MPAYWIARARVIDPAEYKKYSDRVPAIMEKHGGRFLSRAASYETLEGPDHFDRFAILEFDTLADVKRCFDSPEYQEAAEFRRHGAGEVEITVVENEEQTR